MIDADKFEKLLDEKTARLAIACGKRAAKQLPNSRNGGFSKRKTVRQIGLTLCMCHCFAESLDLERLLAADDLNFWHDINGIVKNIDQKTGKLLGDFLPRFAKPGGSAAAQAKQKARAK